MANIRIRFDADRPQGELFSYLADYTHAPEWNPYVQSAIATTEHELGIGSSFVLDMHIGKRVTPFTYTIIEFNPPERVTLEALTKTFYTRDIITLAARQEGGCQLTYFSSLRFRGFAAIMNGGLLVAFPSAGKHIHRRLREVLPAPRRDLDV